MGFGLIANHIRRPGKRGKSQQKKGKNFFQVAEFRSPCVWRKIAFLLRPHRPPLSLVLVVAV